MERKPHTEDADVAAIVQGILTIQTRFAAQQFRPLARGTHAKGICARAQFEVFDIMRTVPDSRLAARLAHGLFAKPGIYPATVRFANAESYVFSDRKADVRAFSFSVELPPGAFGSAIRQDFSMNNATTFPINDAHMFAVLMQVLTAPSKVGALRSLPFRDLLRAIKTQVSGTLQKRSRRRAYQQMRYWSTVPFRHGPADVVKYSAIPGAGNSAAALQDSPNCLQNELIRHLNDDVEMSSFDFGLQLLDTERMTRWLRKRDASYWIENASVEWNEKQAPFHIVGRLTLLSKSQMSADESRSMYIDVTENRTADSQPIGGINRARWSAESASRKARMTQPAAAVPPPPAATTAAALPTRRSTIATIARWAAMFLIAVAALAIGATACAVRAARANIPVPEHVDEVRYLDQGWGYQRESPGRETYYYTPQGASIHGIRYSWFVNLERPLTRARFADPDHLRSLGFIVEPVATHSNPDQLPVGFSRSFDITLNDDVVDVSCAACHTGQLNITRSGKTTAIRIDGGSALNAFTDMKSGHFAPVLTSALISTYVNPFKFNRFARRVLGPEYYADGKSKLAADMWTVIKELAGVGWTEFHDNLYPTQEGFGRTDALARIGNTVFGDHLDPANYKIGDAPVSYPYVWNIWKFDWVQYNASVSQPMARNVGEAMGTGASYQFVDPYGRPVTADQRYRTSISFEHLRTLEDTLQMLKPPQWPEDLLGTVDQAKAEKGRQLFQQHCVGCHGPHVAADALKHVVSPERTADEPLWVIRIKDVQDVGTDPRAATNFARNKVDLSRTGLLPSEVRALLKRQLDQQKARHANLLPALEQEFARRKAAGADEATLGEMQQEIKEAQEYGAELTDEGIARQLDAIDLKSLPVGRGLNIFGLIVRDRYYTDNHLSDQARSCFEGFGMLDLPQVETGYKPRPLEGVWATPPFLHNGSVPNLYELLSPVAERSKTFHLGHREFDPVKVGYAAEPEGTSGFVFNTTLPGNSNSGHEFRAGYVPFDEDKPASAQYQGGVIGPGLTPEERWDVIEYLKIHRDDPKPAPPRTAQDCLALLGGAR